MCVSVGVKVGNPTCKTNESQMQCSPWGEAMSFQPELLLTLATFLTAVHSLVAKFVS